jgi:hypothetical protein
MATSRASVFAMVDSGPSEPCTQILASLRMEVEDISEDNEETEGKEKADCNFNGDQLHQKQKQKLNAIHFNQDVCITP